jgi:hypothetical protein
LTTRNDTGQTAYKRQLAYRHLGINPKDVQYLPFVARQLRRIARRINHTANRGEPSDPSDLSSQPVRALDYLRSSDDPEAQKVVNAYFSVPESYRRLLPLEAFCHAAGVSPWRVLECIHGRGRTTGSDGIGRRRRGHTTRRRSKARRQSYRWRRLRRMQSIP